MFFFFSHLARRTGRFPQLAHQGSSINRPNSIEFAKVTCRAQSKTTGSTRACRGARAYRLAATGLSSQPTQHDRRAEQYAKRIQCRTVVEIARIPRVHGSSVRANTRFNADRGINWDHPLSSTGRGEVARLLESDRQREERRNGNCHAHHNQRQHCVWLRNHQEHDSQPKSCPES